MGYTITNEGSTAKITDGVNNSWIFPVANSTLYHYGDKVRLVSGEVTLDIPYTLVDSPSVASGEALYNAIEAWFTAGGSGDASAANQTTMINSLADLETPSSVTDGEKDVSVTGTAVALASTASMKFVVLTAKSGNGATIWVGGSSVTDDGDTGNPLAAGESMIVYLDDISKVYINGTSTDGVTFSYYN